ncbi:prepilin peptidase|uniref:Leader peptidase (Prepilin peptidase) / N-methyltransferase n=1 Tax=Dendrosporobacter quercicolus TaxID=146817 RepID=A0A1H0A2P3_9FIRM|nr:A24 family peptidase [Dendrosporobacter quercicolus]NSL49987.1 prepilin peptidase [Dendrosporobacter quercicolus DSM 1736]SDN27481.1 leader peptidase (prepilin peptidase) / N-methyltransferase [Dendrosporobacter quercicolus]
MPDQMAFFGMVLTLLALTIIVSQILAATIAGLMNRSVAILEAPQKLLCVQSRRPLILLALIFPLYALSGQLAIDAAQLLSFWVFIAFMLLISVMDFEQQIILDQVLLPLLFLALCFSPVLPALLVNRLLAAAAGGLIFFLIAVLTKGGLGGGDIKLLSVLGLWLGTEKLLLTVLLGCLSAGLISAFLLLGKRKKPGDTIAYGPYFAFSAMIALLA